MALFAEVEEELWPSELPGAKPKVFEHSGERKEDSHWMLIAVAPFVLKDHQGQEQIMESMCPPQSKEMAWLTESLAPAFCSEALHQLDHT